MSHRRNQRNNLKFKSDSKNVNMDESFEKLSTNIRKEKQVVKNNNSKPLLYSITLIVVILGAGIVIFSNTNLTGSNSYINSQGNKLTIPDNMPSRYDTTLTQNPKLESAYQYATDHGDVLSQLICHCGCNNPMHQPYHKTNKECFWTASGAYEPHAENCSTCVYIALSGKTLYEAGWSLSDIRSFIDDQYK